MSDHEIFAVIRRESLAAFLDKLKAVDLSVTTADNRTMLHMAIAYKRPEHSEQLILRGADINAKDAGGQTPLHYAAIHGQVETAKLLVEHNGDLAICDRYGNTPLWYAVFNARGRYDLVQLYVRAGGGAAHQNTSGKSPISFAEQIGDRRLVEVLQRH